VATHHVRHPQHPRADLQEAKSVKISNIVDIKSKLYEFWFLRRSKMREMGQSPLALKVPADISNITTKEKEGNCLQSSKTSYLTDV
jgi:hypothetical protein